MLLNQPFFFLLTILFFFKTLFVEKYWSANPSLSVTTPNKDIYFMLYMLYDLCMSKYLLKSNLQINKCAVCHLHCGISDCVKVRPDLL